MRGGPEPGATLPRYDELPPGHADWFPGGEFGTSSENCLLEDLNPDSPLAEVRQVLGDYRTLAFWEWADREGRRPDRSRRRQVYIPTPHRLRADHSMIAAIGMEGAQRVCEHFRGVTLDVPGASRTYRQTTRRLVFSLSAAGLTPAEIATEINEAQQAIGAPDSHWRTVTADWVGRTLRERDPAAGS